MTNQSNDQNSERAFYDSFWRTQLALSCDEKCRMRFILSEVKRLCNSLVASDRAVSLAISPDRAGRAASDQFRIADVGCGRGWLTHLLSQFGEVTGFDRSITEARKRHPAGRFVECNVLDLPPEDFDVAVCSEVIEHVQTEEQSKLIDSLFSILRPGGALIMTTPNKPQVSRLVGELSLQHELQPVENWLDDQELIHLAGRLFEIKKVRTIMFFPIAVRKIGPLSRVYRALYEQVLAYRVVDPLLQWTKQGLYIGLIARKGVG